MSNKKFALICASAVIALNCCIFHTTFAQEAVKEVKKGNLITQNVPETPADIKEKLIQYQNVRGAGLAGFTPDGGVLITTRFAQTNQVHLVKTPLGARNQITFYDERILSVETRPHSKQFVFSKDTGGDEFFQYFLYDLETGKTKQLTEAGTRNENLIFSKDGKKIAYSVSRSGSPTREIMVMDIDNPASAKMVYKADGGYGVYDFSPDGKKLLMGKYISVQKSERGILDIESGAYTPITPKLEVSYDGGFFSNDGNTIYLTTDENSQFAYGVALDLKTEKRTRITPVQNWDVAGMAASESGNKLLYVVNEGGFSKAYLTDTKGTAPKELAIPNGVSGDFKWNGDEQIGFSLSSATTSSDAFVYSLADNKITRWTESEIGGLNPKTFVEPKLINYPTFDKVNGKQRQIPAFIYEPTTPGKHPVIISIHGGPESQSTPSFSSAYQYWVNELGAVVVVPNVRGSNGYGKEYVSLDNGFKREDSVKDIGALIDYLGTLPNVDKDKIAVYGGSYGGYMVLASMTNFNDKLAGGVDIVGISNFVTFLKNTQGYRVDLRRVEYGDERDPKMREFQEKIAPLNNAQKITKPMFVIQGANDPRVPRSEAEQMVTKIRANGGKVWYMLALDEGHGFSKKNNRDAQREAETLFFKEIFGIK